VQSVSADQAGGKTLITSDFVIRRSEFGIGAGEWNEK
jgi:polyisoprenoid-binding protein YceI